MSEELEWKDESGNTVAMMDTTTDPSDPYSVVEDRFKLTRRDKFAMAALTGLLGNPSTVGEENASFEDLGKFVAEISYEIAAAMMKEREK